MDTFKFPSEPEIMINCFISERAFKDCLGIKKRINKQEDWFVFHQTSSYEIAYDYEEGVKVLISKVTEENVKETVSMIKQVLTFCQFKTKDLKQKTNYGDFYIIKAKSTMLGDCVNDQNKEINRLLTKNGLVQDKKYDFVFNLTKI